MRKKVLTPYFILLIAMFLLPSCKKQVIVANEPIPTKPEEIQPAVIPSPSPTIKITASPSTIERNQPTELSWKSTNAVSILIDGGVGNVSTNGSVQVSPLESTTYTATAKGPGGKSKASTRVTVIQKTLDPLVGTSDSQRLQTAIDEGHVKPIFFEYDKAQLTAQAKSTLKENARWILRFSGVLVVIQGHCDERGTEEYNLALGDRRAQAVRNHLIELGISSTQLTSISYGEERPFSKGHNEKAWRLNRRANFVVKR